MTQDPTALLGSSWNAVRVLLVSHHDGDGASYWQQVLGPGLPRPRSPLGRVWRWCPPALAALTALVVLAVHPSASPLAQGWVALVPIGGLALAARRPLLGWRVLLVWQVVITTWTGLTSQDSNVLLLLSLWGLLPAVHGAVRMSRGPLRVGVIAWSAAVAWFCWARSDTPQGDVEGTVQVLGVIAVAAALGWSAGLLDGSRARALQAQARAERSELAEAVLGERSRIARELHDVVAHRVAVIAVRCESAPYRVQGVTDPVRRELSAVAEDAREALRELHDVLSVLDAPPSGGVSASRAGAAGTELDRRPAPGAADLQEAVAGAVAAGARVELRMHEAVPVALGASQGLTLYRVVTQALANALEHAPGAPVDIVVALHRPGDDPSGSLAGPRGTLEAVILNGPAVVAVGTRGDAARQSGRQDAATARRGSGIEGMRARMALHGGALIAGPTPSGGFRVCATLPLHQPPSPKRAS